MPSTNGHSAKAYFNGLWKDWTAVQGNLNGTWRLASDVFVRQNNEWKQVWVRLTAPTGGSTSLSDVTATISWTAGVGQEGFKLYRNGTFIKNVTSGTSTTDTLPALQTTYTYTVSAYSGATETAQISCGAGVSQGVGTTSAFDITIFRNWTYVNDSWDGQQILFDSSCSIVSNATSYQYSYNGGDSVAGTTASRIVNFGLNQDTSLSVVWRAYRTYNGVNYFGAWSNSRTANAGRPQIRTQETQDIPFDAWGDQERYYTGFGTVSRLDAGYLSANILVVSYQFRNLSVNFGSQITSATRSITISKPGTNITLSGTPYVSNGYNSSVFTNYADQRFRVDPSGTGWFNFNNANKLSGVIRFVVRPVTQSAVAATVS
jgi:hypothetical protein